MRTNPIFVTGSHRSGTTWVGKTIAYAGGTHYLGEIFNTDSPLLRSVISTSYHYVTPEEHSRFTDLVGRILRYDYDPPHRKRAFRWLPSRLALYRPARRWFGIPRPLLKDPIAAMSADWLANTFDMDVVCVIRHPAAFVLSLRKVGWNYGYSSFVDQQSLMDDWLYPYRDLLCRSPLDVIEGGSVVWVCIYHVLSAYIERNPEWQVWRMEDIALDPVSSFRHIYDRLGLPFTRRVAQRVRADSASSNPVDAPPDDPHLIQRNSRALRDQWRTALHDNDLLRIRRVVERVSSAFYSDEDW